MLSSITYSPPFFWGGVLLWDVRSAKQEVDFRQGFHLPLDGFCHGCLPVFHWPLPRFDLCSKSSLCIHDRLISR